MATRGLHYQRICCILFLAVIVLVIGWRLGLFTIPTTFVLRRSETTEITKYDWDAFDHIGRHQDDPMLIEYVRRQIQPPSIFPYALAQPQLHEFSTFATQFVHIKKLFGEMRNGFFIEVGAYDGESHSNTLYWERDYGWSGLLIEPDPVNYRNLMSKHRKSFTLNACLCPTEFSDVITFITNSGMTGKIVSTTPKSNKTTTASIPCYPFYTIMAALGFPPVHYWSLDIEGHEMKVLHTLPSIKDLDIRVILVEHLNLKEGFDALKQFMESNGYSLLEKDYYDGFFYRNGSSLISS